MLSCSGVIVSSLRPSVQSLGSCLPQSPPEAARGEIRASSVGSASSKASSGRQPEVKGGKNAPKRMDSQRLERADSKNSTDGEHSWMSLACWPVPLGRTRIDGSAGRLAASVPVSLPGTAVIFRLAYKQPDWVKWGLAVRKDPCTWLGQATLPLLLGLEPPTLKAKARLETRRSPDLDQEVVLDWALPESERESLGLGGLKDLLWTWQYRWRMDEKEWTMGPAGFAARETVVEGSQGFESGPLKGPWGASLSGSRRLEMSVRYSSQEGLSSEWSGWGSAAVILGLPTPLASEELDVEVNDSDPCEATVRWRAFQIPGFLDSEVDYRVLLRSRPESFCKGSSRCTQWVPLPVETDDDAKRNRVCLLTGLQPSCEYEVRVEGDHRVVLGDGADGLGPVPCYLRWASAEPGEMLLLQAVAEAPPLMADVFFRHGAPALQLRFRSACREALSRFQVCFEAENEERMILPARSVDHPFIRRDEEIKVFLGPAILAPGRYRVRLRAAPALSPTPVWSPWTEAVDALLERPPPRPRVGDELRVREGVAAGAPQSFGEMIAALSSCCVQLSWDSFTSQSLTGYQVAVSLESARHEDDDEVFTPAPAGALALRCAAWLRRLAPETEYHFAVSAANGDAKARLETVFCTGPCRHAILAPLMPPSLAKDPQEALESLTLSLDPRVATRSSQELLWRLQWRPWHRSGATEPWRPAASVQLQQAEGTEGKPAEVKVLWNLGVDAEAKCRQVQLRLCLEDSAAKNLLPQSLWFSHVSEPITTSFEAPLPPTLTLAYLCNQLVVQVEAPRCPGCPGPGDRLAWDQVQRCQVKFRGQLREGIRIADCQAKPQSLTQGQVPAAKVCLSIPISELPSDGFEYSAAVRVGDVSLWSCWSDFGDVLCMKQPAVWSSDGELWVFAPVNHKVTLAWRPLCCGLGAVPIDIAVTIVKVDATKDEVLLGRCGRTARHLASTASGQNAPSDQGEQDHLEVAAHGFQPGVVYEVLLYAQALLPQLQSPQDAWSLPLARSKPFQWPNVSEEWCCLVDWALPRPQQMLLPDGALEESSPRWKRSVLLSWPSIEQLSLEVREENPLVHQVLGWKKTAWVRTRFNDADYVAVFDLPCDLGNLVRFRWVDRACGSVGPSSDICIAHLPPPKLSVEPIDRTGALRVRLTADTDAPMAPVATFLQVRFRTTGGRPEPSTWSPGILFPLPLQRKFTVDVSETHGLVSGKIYVFAAQLLSTTRRSQWSADTVPLSLKLPAITVPGGELTVHAKSVTSVTCSWPKLSSTCGSFEIEFRLDVFKQLLDGLQHQTSVLVDCDDGKSLCEATVFNLQASTEYVAQLSLRLTRRGSRRWQTTGLSTSFIAPGPS
ncbi:Znhit6 [Symbiodinium sp. CCMP2592]|nr:Znhit6 [Symbiodinium sp. CCMP2592]